MHKERQTGIHTDRQTSIPIYIQTNRYTDKTSQAEIQAGIQSVRQAYKHRTNIQNTYIHTGRHTYRQTENTYIQQNIQTYRQAGIHTYRRTYRHTMIHTDKHTDKQANTHTYIQTGRWPHREKRQAGQTNRQKGYIHTYRHTGR